VRALTLWEPWASCIAAGLKQVETRGWKLPRELRGQRIAIHAAKAWHRDDAEDALLLLGNNDGALDRLREHLGGDPWKPSSYPLGCVVATATIVEGLPTANVTTRTDFKLDGRRRLHRTQSWGPLLLSIPVVEASLGGYAQGRWCFLLDEVAEVRPPAPAAGKQGWWDWEPVHA
jgi:hypothetical protein